MAATLAAGAAPGQREIGYDRWPQVDRLVDLRRHCHPRRHDRYVISEVEILDEAAGQRYRELAAVSIARHGGRYVVRGARPDVPEGDWPADQRVVVVEFSDMEQLRNWYASADYAEALAIRETALTRRLLFVEGVGEQDPS